MPKVLFSLVEQFSDLRSNELAYKFSVENQGTVAIDLLSIIPRIPDTVELVEAKDPSMKEAAGRRQELCLQLTRLFHDQILVASQVFREQYVKMVIGLNKEV